MALAGLPDSALSRAHAPIRENTCVSAPAPQSPGAAGSRRLLPWMFVACVAAATMLPVRNWVRRSLPGSADSQAARDAETVWKRAGSPDARHAVDVIRTIDGDTFEARVHFVAGPRADHAHTPARHRRAGAEGFLSGGTADGGGRDRRRCAGCSDEGDVAIFNIGPDKYGGRVVADVATRRTGNVSTGDARGRSCPQLWRRPPQRLVREREPADCAIEKAARWRGFLQFQSALAISVSPSPSFRSRRVDRDPRCRR